MDWFSKLRFIHMEGMGKERVIGKGRGGGWVQLRYGNYFSALFVIILAHRMLTGALF